MTVAVFHDQVSDVQDPNIVYDLKQKLDALLLYETAEVRAFAAAAVAGEGRQGSCSSPSSCPAQPPVQPEPAAIEARRAQSAVCGETGAPASGSERERGKGGGGEAGGGEGEVKAAEEVAAAHANKER